MSEFRNLRLCFEDIEAMEKAGEELMRSHKAAQGLNVLTVALRLRQEWQMYEPLAEGEEVRWSWRPGYRGPVAPFVCNVDESAGMADVVEMHGHSRRV